jgi:hypothetical protein
MKTKTKRSEEIRADLSKIDERIGELRVKLAERKAAKDKADAAYLEDDSKFEEAHAAKSAYMLIDETINNLTENRERLASELESVLTVEAYADTVGAMQTLIHKTAKGREKHVELRRALSDTASDLLQSKGELDQTHAEFVGHLRKILPDVKATGRWPNVNKYTQKNFDTVMAALEQAGISREDIALVMNPPVYPAVEIEAVITAAENHKIWADAEKRTQDRLKNVDKVLERQGLEREAEAKRIEAENREKAVRQAGRKYGGLRYAS